MNSSPPKPLIVSTYDVAGGAGRAAYRLMNALSTQGGGAEMLVAHKDLQDPRIHAPTGQFAKLKARYGYPLMEQLFSRHAQADPSALFSPAKISGPVVRMAREIDADLVHLHWVCGGWVRPEDIPHFDKPVVWTLHDMWAFTGGCHYDDGCGQFSDSCHHCPQLAKPGANDLAARLWRRKRRAWKPGTITVVTPSRWLADEARRSALFREQRVEVIPNPLDLDIFQPRDQAMARTAFGLPQDKKIILFGAYGTGDPRKGFDLLEDAIKGLAAEGWADRAAIAVFGGVAAKRSRLHGFDVYHLGMLNDDIALALAYACANVTVVPSRQENLANIIAESLACGVPCVGFDIGGNGDLIDDRENGALADPFDPHSLGKNIVYVLEDEERHLQLSRSARTKAKSTIGQKNIAQRMLNLYSEILAA